jgi:DNA uptake protein ComE-like DNA-binding protein
LPGIGQARALAIARERWRSRTTPAFATLERVPGIGPETARQAREWLESRGSLP